MEEHPDELPVIEFEVPQPRSWRWWPNPKAAGYQGKVGLLMGIVGAACMIAFSAGILLVLAEAIPARRGTPVAGVSFFGMIIILCLWSCNEFCPSCGARIRGPFSRRAPTWCPACYRLHDAARIGELDLFGLRDWAEHGPIPKFLAITTWLAIAEKCHEIRLEPQEDEYRIFLLRGEETLEMVSPPAFIQFAVAQTAKSIAGLDLKKCDETQQGHIRIKVPRTVETDVVIEPGEFGQKVTFRFGDTASA